MAKIADMVEKISETVTGGYQKVEDKFTEKFLEEDGSLKTGKIGEGVVEGYKKIEDAVVGGYKKIEKGVVDGYKKIEQGVVGGYTKIEDKFVDAYLTKDGETIEEAKARLKEKK